MRWLISVLLVVMTAALSTAQPRVDGNRIVDEAGNPIAWRGVNFGSWLMLETWISDLAPEWDMHARNLAREAGIEEQLEAAFGQVGPFDDDTQNWYRYIERLHAALQARTNPQNFAQFTQRLEEEPYIPDARAFDRILRERFGDEGAQEIWDAYHDNWITEIEFRRTKALGFNLIRLPFWYWWFEKDETPYHYHEYGFRYLDRAIDWAQKYDLSIMLDLHGAVGGQNPWDHTGDLSRGELFEKPEYVKRSAALWQEIARRYRDNDTVVAYSLLNEPFSAQDRADWLRVHDALYEAIRAVDPNKIIVMEDGYKLEDEPYFSQGFFLPPEQFGWENVVYSFHFYQTGSIDDHRERAGLIARIAKREQERAGVPFFAGEFNTIDDTPDALAGLAIYLKAFNRMGIHWTPWTFKFTRWHEPTLWGLYQYTDEWRRPNIHKDSKTALLQTMKRLHGRHFGLHYQYAAVLRDALQQPFMPEQKQAAPAVD